MRGMTKPSTPEIKVKPPGPKALKILEKDKAYVSPSYTRDLPFVLDRGEDVWVWDVDGNRYLDFTSGIGVLNCGHGHPVILEAVRKQVDRFSHMAGTDFYYDSLADVSEQLALNAPGSSAKRVFLTNSGAETVEAGLKLARYITKRPRFLAFYGGFHGRTMGALSFTASKAIQRQGFSPLLNDVTHAPYPDPTRGVVNGKPENATEDAIRFIEKVIFKRVAAPSDVAAVMVEPIQGEGGYIVPPTDFLGRLKKVCEKHGILMIADEIQTGFGRTGKLFACEHVGVAPDILLAAKGIANGFPLGAMIARADIMTWPPGAHASTFGGNPVSCAASLKVIELVKGGLADNSAKVGAYLGERLAAIADKHAFISEQRGVGLMQAIEFVTPGGDPDPDRREKILLACFDRGLILLPCGDGAIRFIPSLTVTRGIIDTAVDIFEESLENL
jgi:4-aminobutyrate aminotransferase